MPNVAPPTQMQRSLAETDPEIASAIRSEIHRQSEGLELIASENFVSSAILEAAGSVLTNKYAEGCARYNRSPVPNRDRLFPPMSLESNSIYN